MVSIIISSVDPSQLKLISHNINLTIGVPYEIISFNNNEGKFGICEIYNKGVKAAKYDTLCFMHEDIEIQTMNWGEITLNYFKNDKHLGLIGVAGSNNKSSTPGGCDSLYGTTYINIIQHYKFKKSPPEHVYLPKSLSKNLNRVVCIDGVWFCCPKKVALEFPFDENLKGFHGYDIDFSLSVNQKYTVAVTHEILMKHFSEGNFSKEWLTSMIYIHKKRKNQLPIYLEIPPNKSLINIEKKTFRYLLKKYKKDLNISFSKGLEILNNSNIRSFGLLLYFKMYYSLIKIIILKK